MFKNPFSFNGRIRRTEYGITFVIYLAFYFFSLVLDESNAALAVLYLLLLVPVLWFIWAQGAKRCHDMGRNGWYQIIPLYFFVMLFQEGDLGKNKYGHNPKYPAPADVLEAETLDGNFKS